MSRPALVISVLVASGLTLVLVALLLQPESPTSGSAGRLLQFEPGAVAEITIEYAEDAPGWKIDRGDDGGWRLSRHTGSGDAGQPWALIPTRVRGLLSVLGSLEGSWTKRMEVDNLRSPITLTLHDQSGERTVLTIEGVTIGGSQLVLINGERAAIIEDDLAGALTKPGPAGWRSSSPLPGIGPEIARFSLQTSHGSLQLRRLGRTWLMSQPIDARADTETIGDLLSALSDLTVQRFFDNASEGPTIDEAGLNAPFVAIEIENDVRVIEATGDTSTRVETRNLIVGIPADVSGATRYAMANNGPPMLVIDAKALAEAPVLPQDFISPLATGLPASEIGMVVLQSSGASERGFRRTVDGWALQAASGDEPLVDWSEVEELVAFLTEARAADRLVSAPEGLVLQGELTLLNFAGEELVSLPYGFDELGDLVISETIPGGRRPAYRIYKAAPGLLAAPARSRGG